MKHRLGKFTEGHYYLLRNMDIDYKIYHRDADYLEFESMFRNLFLKRFNIIKKFTKSHGRVLDIGASTGTMLDIFKEDRWKTWGVEPSKSATIAESKGHKMIKDFFEKSKLPQNYFDVVILNHTLEHMDYPQEVLKKVYGLLKKGGIVFIDVPNFGSLGSRILEKRWPYLLPEEHKHQFTKKSLKGILQKTGYEILHLESRSGLFEYANPALELWNSLSTLKKRFFFNVITLPYAAFVTILNMGDSISFIAKKV